MRLGDSLGYVTGLMCCKVRARGRGPARCGSSPTVRRVDSRLLQNGAGVSEREDSGLSGWSVETVGRVARPKKWAEGIVGAARAGRAGGPHPGLLPGEGRVGFPP